MVRCGSALLDFEEALAVFDRLTVFDEDFEDRALSLGLNLVHDFHGLNDANNGGFHDFGADIRKRLTFRGGRSVKRADHRRLDV